MTSGVFLCVLVVGCSGDPEVGKAVRSSAGLQKCGQFLGAENINRAVESVDGGKATATARNSPERLAAIMDREAEEWAVDDLLHNSYSACRIQVPAEGGGAFVIEATVQWSVLTVDSMSDPKYAKSWRQLNDQVFVELETGRPSMELLVACGVPGAAAGQEAGLPLQMAVTDPGLAVDQRQVLLSTFARTLVDELSCAGDPVIPAQLLR
ncbi:hypothetical protein [Streptomyces sp. f150]|uniref:hypothetical protein n=1 Tax=Streptomyces sp. f150 TaxID=1827699 RepID=UPI0011813FA7|nr:hypothetical protein [Streptomyces sp. f150]